MYMTYHIMARVELLVTLVTIFDFMTQSQNLCFNFYE